MKSSFRGFNVCKYVTGILKPGTCFLVTSNILCMSLLSFFQDAKVNTFLKTNFPNLDETEPSVSTRVPMPADQGMKRTSPQAASKQDKPKVQELVSSPEAASTSKDVVDSDKEVEKQRPGQEEEKRTGRNSETESKKSSVSVKSKKDGKANDCNMSCSTNHYIW